MPKKSCPDCAKRSYENQTRAITVALRCSRLRGTALRAYQCPHGHGWHLTRRPSWHAAATSPTRARPGLGYRRTMAAILADRLVVEEVVLITAAAEHGGTRYSVTAARAVVDAWCVWGLAYPHGDQVIAVDLPGLRYISEHGWTTWLTERSSSRSYA